MQIEATDKQLVSPNAQESLLPGTDTFISWGKGPGGAKQLGISKGTEANLFRCPTAGSHYIIGLSTPLSLPRVQCPQEAEKEQ